MSICRAKKKPPKYHREMSEGEARGDGSNEAGVQPCPPSCRLMLTEQISEMNKKAKQSPCTLSSSSSHTVTMLQVWHMSRSQQGAVEKPRECRSMGKGIIEIWRQWGMVILFSRNPSSMNLQKFWINPNIMKNRLRSLMFVFLWRQGQKRWFQLRIANQGLLSYMYKNINPFQNYLFLFLYWIWFW